MKASHLIEMYKILTGHNNMLIHQFFFILHLRSTCSEDVT